MPFVDGVIGRDFVNLLRTLVLRLGRIDDRRQHFKIGDDFFRGVFGLRGGFRNHHRIGIADIAYLASRKCGMRRHLHRRAVLGVNGPAADQAAKLVEREIVAGKDRENTRHRGRCRGVDFLQLGMRMRRSQEMRDSLAGPRVIVGIVALAGDETLVFFAAHRSANSGRSHGKLLPRIIARIEKPVSRYFCIAFAPAAIALTMLW